MVRANSTIPAPSRGWGNINGSSVGVIKSIKPVPTGSPEVVVEFEEEKEWTGTVDDVELSVTPVVGDSVQVKLSVVEPYLKWGGVNHTNKGVVKKINKDLQLGR